METQRDRIALRRTEERKRNRRRRRGALRRWRRTLRRREQARHGRELRAARREGERGGEAVPEVDKLDNLIEGAVLEGEEDHVTRVARVVVEQLAGSPERPQELREASKGDGRRSSAGCRRLRVAARMRAA